MKSRQGVSVLVLVLTMISAAPRTMAEPTKTPGDPAAELDRLCGSRPSRKDVEGVRDKFRGLCDFVTNDTEQVLQSVEQHCEVVSERKRSGRPVSSDLARPVVEYLSPAIADLNSYLACGVLAPTFADLRKLGDEVRIKRIWATRVDVATRQELAMQKGDDAQVRCLQQALARFDADMQRRTLLIDNRVVTLSDEANRCVESANREQSGLSLGLTLSGASLLIAGTAALIWGSTAVCTGRDVVGDCLDGDRVNQQRLTGWIVGGAGAVIGAGLGVVGIVGLAKRETLSSPQITLNFGPGTLALQGHF